MKKFFMIVLLTTCILAGAFAQAAAEAQPLRIGIMPDVDSLPMQLAATEGLFETEGAQVELIPFRSPVERDAAFQAGELDGMVGDTLGAFFLREAGFDTVITSITNGRYGIAANPVDGAAKLSDLAGKEVAVSRNTIIEYIADELMKASPAVLMAIPKIPVRMEMLLNGSIAGACLPEPLYSIAVSKGAVALADSTQLDEVPGVMIFTTSSVAEKADALTAFYRAYAEACSRINENPKDYRDFLVTAAGVPEDIRDEFVFVTYDMPRLPESSQVMEVEKWLTDRDLITHTFSYDEMTDSSVVESL